MADTLKRQILTLELDRFRAAAGAADAEAMVVENNAFHATIGAMAHSAFLQPSLNKLLIDHARIGHTVFRPINDEMRANLATAADHHDQFIDAIGERDVAAIVRLAADALGRPAPRWASRRSGRPIRRPPPAASRASTAASFST